MNPKVMVRPRATVEVTASLGGLLPAAYAAGLILADASGLDREPVWSGRQVDRHSFADLPVKRGAAHAGAVRTRPAGGFPPPSAPPIPSRSGCRVIAHRKGDGL